jgi:CelD/BcsL family acetyltransferase involved in cellulose biosynthesis
MSLDGMAGLSATVKLPSQLNAAETAAWYDFMSATPELGRGFLSPRFARACEQAHGRARVAVLRDGAGLAAFLPFQFRSAGHATFGAAEPIGGGLADHAGIVARPGLAIVPSALLRLIGLGSLFVPQLSPGQARFGLSSMPARIGHLIDLSQGPEAYFGALAKRDKAFFQDTERRARRLEKELGAVTFSVTPDPPAAAVEAVIAAKRSQFDRTGVGDPLAPEDSRRLLLALARDGGADCRVVISRLAAGERVLAQHLGLLHGQTLSYWFPVYDPDARRVSPGRMLLWHTIRASAVHGITLIDRGGGDSQAKRDFSTGTVEFGTAHYLAPGVRGHVARVWQAAAWRLGL